MAPGDCVTRPLESRDDADKRSELILAQLREANERLILAALHSQIESESAALRLSAAQRTAELDALTALPNRTLLQDRFHQAAAIATRHGTRLAVLFLDLNDFKRINDTLGHFAGDQVLRHVATTLVSAVRAADTVSRHGGDEFVVLLTDVDDRSDVSVTAEKVLASLAAPTQHGQHVVRLAASIGISLFPDDGDTIEALTALADAAMYDSKRRGAAHYSFHGDASDAETVGEPPMIELQPHTLTLASEARLENERQTALMRTANEQLVLATLDARAIQTELEVANRRQTDFMAVLAHELRNPLAPMRNVSALLARIQPDDPILPRLQDIIERQVVHMARMIDDLLDVTRAQNGTLAVNKRTTELTALVADAIATCQPEMDLRQQELTSNLPSSPVYVVGDAIRLTQIFTNLLSSASKYTRNGGSLTLAMTADAPNVVVTLIDNDSAPTTDARLTIFAQFDPDVHSRGVRRSIGLTVIDELVKAHGGSVTARVRAPGCGNQLVVTLPILRGASVS